MIYFGEVEGELWLPASGNQLLQKEGCRVTSKLELRLVRDRRSVQSGEKGEQSRAGSGMNCCFWGHICSRFLQVSPESKAGSDVATCWKGPGAGASVANWTAGHPWWSQLVTHSLSPWRQWQLSLRLLQLPKLLQITPWTVWHTSAASPDSGPGRRTTARSHMPTAPTKGVCHNWKLPEGEKCSFLLVKKKKKRSRQAVSHLLPQRIIKDNNNYSGRQLLLPGVCHLNWNPSKDYFFLRGDVLDVLTCSWFRLTVMIRPLIK